MRRLLILVAILTLASSSGALVTRYTSQAAFETELAALGVPVIHEGFEDYDPWGTVRTPDTAYTVTSQGIIWTANNANSGVTTGTGPARTGIYGFFELPHGDWNAGITDGWIMTGESTLFGAGGWLETNTYGARVNLVLDGSTVVDFEDVPLDYAHQFYGVIDNEGFQSVEVVETEATPGDEWYFVFGDDFYFGMVQETGLPQDAVPEEIVRLGQNAPNPFNPSTTISFTLPETSRVTLSVHDLAGRVICVLHREAELARGEHQVRWHGVDDQGGPVSSGIYLYRLLVDGQALTRKMTLIK